jgi:hypothetical protein
MDLRRSAGNDGDQLGLSAWSRVVQALTAKTFDLTGICWTRKA